MLFAALRWALFWILLQSTHHVSSARQEVSFARPLAELRLYCWVYNGTNRFTLKRRFQWWSYRQYWLFWPLLENPGCREDFQAVCSFLTPFLAWTILKKVVQWSYKYSQSIELDESFPKRHSSTSLAGWKTRYHKIRLMVLEVLCEFLIVDGDTTATNDACLKSKSARWNIHAPSTALLHYLHHHLLVDRNRSISNNEKVAL